MDGMIEGWWWALLFRTFFLQTNGGLGRAHDGAACGWTREGTFLGGRLA